MTKPETHQIDLPNGLTVLGEVNKAHKSCGMGYFVRTGSRDEQPSENGVSHFLEHMMFKGTKKRSALDITMDLGNIGAQANAFTSEENTVYYSAILPEYFETLQELLSDMLRPALTQEDFDTEKNVILEEIALYQDRPHFNLFENASRDFFGGHTGGNSVLGTTASVSGISSQQMGQYFSKRYTPSNMVLVASGNFDWDGFVKAATSLTSSWADSKVERTYQDFKPSKIDREYKRKGLAQSHVLLLSGGCSAQDEERYPLGVLSVIVGDGSGSKFYWELVDKGIAETASAESDERDRCGVFSAFASTEPERLDEVSKTMRRLVEAALDFSEAELERAKTKIVTRLALGSELPMGRLMSLGMEWNYRKKIHSVKDEIEKIQNVTTTEIVKALEKFKIAELSEFRLVPE